MILAKIGAHRAKINKNSNVQVRYFWEYINMMFNKPDPDRIKLVGPDRACAEWVLRNGGKVVWETGKKLADYNVLPPDNEEVPKIIEIDGTASSISHYGFGHLSGCSKLSKVILDNSTYIDDRAIQGLSYGSLTLTDVKLANLLDVTDAGLKEIKELNKLKNLDLHNLPAVNNLDECLAFLKSQLPKCKIQIV